MGMDVQDGRSYGIYSVWKLRVEGNAASGM